MSAVRDANRYALLLYLSAAAFTAELIHLIVYAFDDGIAPSFAEAMAFGGHHSYFLAAFAVTAIALAMAIVLSPLDLKSIRSRASGRRFALAWLAMMVVGSIGFLVLENLETLHGDHPLAGLSPTHWMIDPGVLATTALVCAAIAGVVTILTTPRPTSYAAVLTTSYADLVATGVYDAAFQHADWATAFFDETLRGPLATIASRRPLRVLEAGVGTGFWLGKLPGADADPSAMELRGFDLSAEMVGAARQRLEAVGIAAELVVGDILDDDAYAFPHVIRHDIVFAYDVVQQLPRELQDSAVTQLYRHVADGGWLVDLRPRRSFAIRSIDGSEEVAATSSRHPLGALPLHPLPISLDGPSARPPPRGGRRRRRDRGRGRGPASRAPREAFRRPVLGSIRSPRGRSRRPHQ